MGAEQPNSDWRYQLTVKGRTIEFTAKGTRYYADDHLN